MFLLLQLFSIFFHFVNCLQIEQVTLKARRDVSAFVTLKKARQEQKGLRVHSDPGNYENDSLSHTISSPERYAAALDMSVKQVEEIKSTREKSLDDLQAQLAQTKDGVVRHRLICEHRFLHGKHPFVCKNCWSYNPICICNEVPQRKSRIPCERIILWTHHSEWGSPSNTGSVLPLLLENTQLMMKGLHDEEFQNILCSDPTIQPIVLWPNVNKHSDAGPSSIRYVSVDDLIGKKIMLLAIEGTWRQARRMVAKLPYPRLSLENHTPSKTSVLAPLRSQKEGPEHSICTAEAVVSALERLGMEANPVLLDTVCRKVDQTRRYQGKSDQR